MPQSAFTSFRFLLVGCDSPLQTVVVVWSTFLKFEACQTAIIVSSGLPHPTEQVQILKKVRQLTITADYHLPTGWAALPSEKISRRFSRAEKPLLRTLMNMKGLRKGFLLQEKEFKAVASCKRKNYKLVII
jgi:hypothetical protein